MFSVIDMISVLHASLYNASACNPQCVKHQAFSSITPDACADLLFLKAHILLPLAPAVARLLCGSVKTSSETVQIR